jgi:hypothetical protein
VPPPTAAVTADTKAYFADQGIRAYRSLRASVGCNTGTFTSKKNVAGSQLGMAVQVKTGHAPPGKSGFEVTSVDVLVKVRAQYRLSHSHVGPCGLCACYSFESPTTFYCCCSLPLATPALT